MSAINLDLFSAVCGHALQGPLTESLIFNVTRKELFLQSILRFYLNRFIAESGWFIIQAFSCRFIICRRLPQQHWNWVDGGRFSVDQWRVSFCKECLVGHRCWLCWLCWNQVYIKPDSISGERISFLDTTTLHCLTTTRFEKSRALLDFHLLCKYHRMICLEYPACDSDNTQSNTAQRFSSRTTLIASAMFCSTAAWPENSPTPNLRPQAQPEDAATAIWE